MNCTSNDALVVWNKLSFLYKFYLSLSNYLMIPSFVISTCFTLCYHNHLYNSLNIFLLRGLYIIEIWLKTRRLNMYEVVDELVINLTARVEMLRHSCIHIIFFLIFTLKAFFHFLVSLYNPLSGIWASQLEGCWIKLCFFGGLTGGIWVLGVGNKFWGGKRESLRQRERTW
jgi:hypothetical protein